MPNIGATIRIFENNALASGYQVGFEVGAAGDSVTGFTRPNVAAVQNHTGAPVSFDAGYPSPGNALVYCQPPGRDTMGTVAAPALQGGGNRISAAYPYFVSSVFPDSAFNGISVQVGDEVRLWFVKVALQLFHEDASHPLKERWVGGGMREWSGAYGSGGGAVAALTRGQSWVVAGQADYADFQYNDPLSQEEHTPPFGHTDYLLHGYTDNSGVIEYRFLAAWAVRQSGVWRFYSPLKMVNFAGIPVDTTGDPSDIELYVDRHGRHPRKPWLGNYAGLTTAEGSVFPWSLLKDDGSNDESHQYTQAELGAQVDYTTWDGSGGFTTPSPAQVTHRYRQAFHVTVLDSDHNPVAGATVVYGPYSGTTDVNGEATIYGIPRGSTLAQKLPWLTNPAGDLTEIPLQDASAFAGESTAQLKLSTYGNKAGAGPDDTDNIAADRGAFVTVTPSGSPTFTISGNTLTSVVTHAKAGDFDGGECMTLQYEITVTKGSDSASQKEYLWEDCITEVKFDNFGGASDNPQDGNDLDYAEGHFEDFYLTEAKPTGLKIHESGNREQSFQHHSPLVSVAQRLYSPSRVILPDHRHLLGLVVEGDVKLYRSEDGGDFDRLPILILAEDEEYAAVCLRRAPDETLVAWCITAGGTVKKTTSGDGGESWDDPPVTVATLPTGKPQRGDVRHTGMEWLRAHVHSDGSLHLYSSTDEDEWTHEGQIAPSGAYPWLWVLPDDTIRVEYHDGTDSVERYGQFTAAAGWTWGAANIVTAAGQPGAVGFANTQKVVSTARNEDFTMAFRKTYDQETWEDGAFG